MKLLLPSLLLSIAAFAEEPAADIAPILEKIRKGSPAECVEAIGKLTPGKEERAAKPMAVRLITEADAQARAVIREALGAYKGMVLVQAMKTGLETKGVTDDYRQIAIELLAPEKSEAAVALVVKIAFASEMKAMRESGQKALVAYEDLSIKPTLPYLKAGDQKIASEAVATMKSIGTEAVGKALILFIPDGGEKEILRIVGITNKTRDQVAKALIDMGDKAVPGLLTGLDSPLYVRWSGWCLQQMTGETYATTDRAAWAAWWKRRQAENSGR
ncbi:MAG: hypothetical protein AAB074_22560 [Planctomycetota bacterium]